MIQNDAVFHYRPELKFYLTDSHLLTAGKCFNRRHRNRPTYLWKQTSITTDQADLC